MDDPDAISSLKEQLFQKLGGVYEMIIRIVGKDRMINPIEIGPPMDPC